MCTPHLPEDVLAFLTEHDRSTSGIEEDRADGVRDLLSEYQLLGLAQRSVYLVTAIQSHTLVKSATKVASIGVARVETAQLMYHALNRLVGQEGKTINK